MEKAILKINFKETILKKNIIGILILPAFKTYCKETGIRIKSIHLWIIDFVTRLSRPFNGG